MRTLRDVEQLRVRAATLATRAETDSRAVAERRAAAEAYMRLALLDSKGDAHDLLRRAVELDPYRADAWFLLARAEHASGDYAAALKRVDTAALISPHHARLALLRARAQIRLAATTGTAAHADAAMETLVRALTDDDRTLLIAIDATIHASAKSMREKLPGLLARIRAVEVSRMPVTRLLYLALASLSVGAKHDARNRETLLAISAVVDRYTKAGFADPAMTGVEVAAKAKACSPEEICERVDAFARNIPDVRLVRLLLRERLATVVDPAQRLALFERAMAKIPSLDGITHDYLQLLHLVAKRAVAVGDFDGARATWTQCLEVDADNLAVLENLRLLARRSGDAKQRIVLERQIAELRRIYVAYSPRADLVMTRHAATLLASVEDTLEARTTGDQTIELSEVPALLHLLARAGAIGRAAHGAFHDIAPELLDPEVSDLAVFETAVELIARPLDAEVPSAYALIDTAKDASQEVVADAVAKRLEALDIQLARDPSPRLSALRARVEHETAALIDSSSRAVYDSRTAPVALAEALRHYARVLGAVLAAMHDVTADDPKARIAIVDTVRRMLPDHVRPYMTTDRASDRALEDDLFVAMCGPALEPARVAAMQGDVEKALDVMGPYAERSRSSRIYHELMAPWITDDLRVTFDLAVHWGREHARAAQRFGSLQPLLLAMATESDLAFRQRVARDRAMRWRRRDQPQQALADLLSALNPEVRAQERGPAGTAWTDVQPTGGPQFAHLVADVLRSTTISWYNGRNPTSPHTLMEMRRATLVCLRSANRWAHYVLSLATEEVDGDADDREAIAEFANNLLAQLEKDRVALMGNQR